MAEPILLIDSDMLAHRHMVVHEQEVEVEEGVWSRFADVSQALSAYHRHIREYMNAYEVTDPNRVIHCFTARNNFRRHIFTGYKKNRGPKPIGYGHMVRTLLKQPSAMRLPQLEADDLIGIYSDLATRQDICPIVVSGDKDLKQIPGYHAEWFGTDPFLIQEHEAEQFFYAQILTGDSTDGIPGCPGCGPVSAAKILSSSGALSPWEKIVLKYEKEGFDGTEAIVQARLVRILRLPDYNLETNEINLWLPPTLPTPVF